MPGKKNMVADGLSRINIEGESLEREKEEVVKVFHIIKETTDLGNITKRIKL